MPIYQYAARQKNDCPFSSCEGNFEEFQSVSDATLTECPACSAPCRRLISKPSIKKQDRGESGVLQPHNLARNGFTQYKKAGNSVWEKTAGDGPQHLHRED